jgi:hypothetical protein
MQVSAFNVQTKTDPSIEELRGQLDAFVNQIQGRLQELVDPEMPSRIPAADVGDSDDTSPLGRLSAIKQRLAERMEHCNGS